MIATGFLANEVITTFARLTVFEVALWTLVSRVGFLNGGILRDELGLKGFAGVSYLVGD